MTEPTDNELDALILQHWPAAATATLPFRWIRAAFREGLAKWGTSAPVGAEPIGYLYCGGSYGDELADWEIVADQHQCDKLNEHHGSLGKEAKLPIYTTPQPTQAQAGAVPLTDERVDAAVDTWFSSAANNFDFRVRMRAAIDAAHGIKGGQHGSNT